MMKSQSKKRQALELVLSVAAASLALVGMFGWLADSRASAAPLAAGIGTDPRLEAITVTASCPISDTAPGDAVTKTVYYSSAQPSVVTLTTEISGSPVLTLSAGAAFGTPVRIYTSTQSPWTEQVTYTTDAANHTDIVYSVFNTNTSQIGMSITYIQDITAPTASIVQPESGYVTGTQLLITGTAYDNVGGSGIRQVQIMTDTEWITATDVAVWSYTWQLSQADGVAYTISARAQDYVGMLQTPAATVAITVDNVAPANPDVITATDGTVTSQWVAHNTIPISWTAVTDGSGAEFYYRWDQSSSATVTGSDDSTAGLSFAGIPLSHGNNWWFHLRTRDGAGNWAADTAHLGPFQVDLQLPTVSLQSPATGTLFTTTHQPTVTISGIADDVGSGLDYVQVNTGSGWNTASGTVDWEWVWTLPTVDNQAYSLSAQAVDNVGNISTTLSVLVDVDTVLPANPDVITATDGTVTGQWVARDTIPISWTDVTDGSDVEFYYRWDQSSSATVTGSDDSTTGLSFAGIPLPHGDNWWFHLRTRDGAGNWATDTAHLGPFWVDVTSPTILIQAPSAGTLLTTTHQPSIVISGTASDIGSGLDYVQVNTGSGWNTASGTAHWEWVWTLPTADNQPFTLSARAVDSVGNVGYATTVLVDVDTVSPTSATPIPDQSLWVSTTVEYTWSSSTDGNGIAGYEIWMTNDQGYSTTTGIAAPSYTFGFTEVFAEQVNHYARVRAIDSSGNTGPWSASSTAVASDRIPPVIVLPDIAEYSAFFHDMGLTLFYTNTITTIDGFDVGGQSSDSLSGLGMGSGPGRATFSFALGQKPPDDMYPGVFTGHYNIAYGTTENGVITATVYDEVSNTSIQTYTYELDNTRPESTADSPDYATSSPIVVTVNAGDAQCGVDQVTLWYRKEVTGMWAEYETAATNQPGSVEFTINFVPSDADGTYYFRTTSQDHVGNPEPASLAVEDYTIYDTQAPSSEATGAPQYTRNTPIAVTWVATPSLAPLVETRLWYRVDSGPWTSTSHTSSGTSGTFFFTPPHGDGLYEFSTVSLDESGKYEETPYTAGDSSTAYDTQILAPVSLDRDPGGWTKTNTYTLTWANPIDLSGISGAYYRIGSAPAFREDGTWVAGQDLEQISGVTVPDDGVHTVWIWLADNAENTEHTIAQSTTLRYDSTIESPTSLVATPHSWTATNHFDIEWTNPSDMSGITGAYYKLDSVPAAYDDGTWVAGNDLEQILGLSVSADGEHPLYLWLGDAAGNVNHQNRRRTYLQYDATPPADVSIQSPANSVDPAFTISWSATDAASGVVTYTIEYSAEEDANWHTWLISTTDTSTTFTAPISDTTYAFRVTAYDAAGNSAAATSSTRVGDYYIYLPVVIRNWTWWYQYDIFEPNNSPEQAYGPIQSGQAYQSYIWNATDTSDYYHFTPSTSSQVQVTLSQIPSGCDFDLYAYYYSGGEYQLVAYSNRSGAASETISFTPVAGRQYFVRVFRYAGSSSQQQYRLVATYQ